MNYHGMTIEKPGHDTVLLIGDKTTIIVDPFQIDTLPEADIVLITHDHYDHLSPDDLKKVVNPNKTFVLAPTAAREKLIDIKAKQIDLVRPGFKRVINGVAIEAVAAYNVNKWREPGKPFHPKESNYVGYIISMGGVKIYHTGDSDVIDEMKELGQIDVMFVPVSGTYVMTVDEAVEAVKMVKPKVAIPMHYGAIVGDRAQAEEFKQKVGDLARVEIL